MGYSLGAPQSMGFNKQEYWRGLPFSSPWDLPNPGIEPWSPALQADSLPAEPPGKLIEGIDICIMKKKFNYLENEMSSIYV